jgi:PTH1 family peptidyl-tRNA hydrolase
MFLIVGLGNPGEKYENTRHNVGFLFLDYLADMLKVSFSSSKWQAQTAKAHLDGNQLLLLKPETYMNKSGYSVAAAASYYKIPNENIIVIHDDIDLMFGQLKVAVNRGSGGHNGIKSIVEHIGSQDFVRIRVGIGRPDTPIPVDRYVLSKLSKSEIEEIQERYQIMVQGIEYILCQDVKKAVNKLHSYHSRN